MKESDIIDGVVIFGGAFMSVGPIHNGNSASAAHRVQGSPTSPVPGTASTKASTASGAAVVKARTPSTEKAAAAARQAAQGAERATRTMRTVKADDPAFQAAEPRRGICRGPLANARASAATKAFDARIAELEKAVQDGRPGAHVELKAVLKDRDQVNAAIDDIRAKIVANEDKKTWDNVKPSSRAAAEQADLRAQLQAQLDNLDKFGERLAKVTPTERRDLQNFFALAEKDPAALQRFVESQRAAATTAPGAPGPLGPQGSTGSTGIAETPAPAGMQAAIDFALTQQGAPYVGGGSPFRFGTPGDGNVYQMAGQRPHVSPLGVVGYDCSGFVVTVLKKAGIDISRYASSGQMKANLPEVPKDQLRPGDLLVKNGHVSMYIGNGQMIESVPDGVRVTSASTYINDPAYTGHRPG
jgi:cell wall-associated NlpC family hydrolase